MPAKKTVETKSAPKEAKKEAKKISFYTTEYAIDVHDRIVKMRNQGYKYGVITASMIPLIGASIYYNQVLMTLPLGALAGYYWALHLDRFQKFHSWSKRPLLAPGMMMLNDNEEKLPFEQATKLFDYKVPLKSVFRFQE